MRRLLTICFILLSVNTYGQLDSARSVLKLEDFIQIVLVNHPVVKQADLVTESAQANLRQARGGFDPKLTSSFDLKNFKETEYYDIFNATLKVPTNSPITPKIAFDRNEGTFLNRENRIPDSNNNRQVSAGIAVPIGKGLFIDERRLALRQAKIYQDVAGAERIKMTNKILLSALKDYWNWYKAYRKLVLLEQSLDIATEIFDRVMLDYGYGEVAVVDTIQANITYQSRQADYEKVKFELLNAGLELSMHLWSPDEQPLELQDGIIPDVNANFGVLPSLEGIDEMLIWAKQNHPHIVKLNNKIKGYEVDNMWYRESLKPQVDLSYSFIDSPLTPQGETSSPSFSDNYKLGLDFSFPIFLRKERGKLQKNRIKIKDTFYDLQREQLAIQNSIKSKYAETQMSQTLALQFEQIADNYNRLLQAEFLNVETGESDLFKLNVQQDKLIVAQLKYLDNLVKFQKNKAEILHEAGVPFLSLN